MIINADLKDKIQKLDGPIFVFGAGGFIGINLFNMILSCRKDVFAITQDPRNNWRLLVNYTPVENIISCDINEITILKDLFRDHKPKTIFNLAAYGAYSKQKEYKKIYNTNFNSVVNIIELLKETGFSAYIHAGSSSEYGTNCAAPLESEELVPNSHYAVSKVASWYSVKYYGKHEMLPAAHLRLYSAYGPWEEPDRLVPVMVAAARKQQYPPLVDPDISRDFIYVDDVCTAFVLAAFNIQSIKGEAFNIGTGEKTTIRDLAMLMMRQYNISQEPQFNGMPNRNWDVKDWYANAEKARNVLSWTSTTSLTDGLSRVDNWQKEVKFDTAFWNWNRQ